MDAGDPPLGIGAWLIPRNTLLSTCVTLTNSVIQVKRYERNCRDPPENFDPSCPPPFKVTGTDTDRSATYDFLLVIYSNHESILYRFRDKKRYLQNYPTPRVFNALAEGFPLELCNGGGAQKTRLSFFYTHMRTSIKCAICAII